MSLMLVSRHEPYPLLLNKYVVSYKVLLATPEDSLAKNYESANDLYIELEVPKSEYKNEQVQEIIRWSRLPARDPHYYRDIAIHLVVMGGFERSIVFSHGRISCERTADTEADFETIKIFVSQKEDRYEGVVFGTDLDATYAKSWEMLKPKPVKLANLVQTSEIDGPIFNENDFDFSNINSVVDAGMVGDLETSQKKVYTGRFIMINASNVQVLDHFDKSYDGKEYELPFYDSQSSEFLDKKAYTIKELYEKGYRITESREFSLKGSKSDWLNYIPEDEIHEYRVCEITYRMQYASIQVDNGSDEKTFYGYLADDKPYDQLYGNAGYEAYVVDYEEMLKFMGFKNVVASELKITEVSSMGTKISVPKAGYPGKPREYLDNLKLSVLVSELNQAMQVELDGSENCKRAR